MTPGIGLEFVKQLHAKKCNVVIADLQLTEAASAFIDSTSSSSTKVLFKRTDVTVWKMLGDAFEFTTSNLGVPDIVVPCAGVFLAHGEIYFLSSDRRRIASLPDLGC